MVTCTDGHVCRWSRVPIRVTARQDAGQIGCTPPRPPPKSSQGPRTRCLQRTTRIGDFSAIGTRTGRAGSGGAPRPTTLSRAREGRRCCHRAGRARYPWQRLAQAGSCQRYFPLGERAVLGRVGPKTTYCVVFLTVYPGCRDDGGVSRPGANRRVAFRGS